MNAPRPTAAEPPALRPPASFPGAPTGELEDLAAGDVALVGLFLDHGDATGFGARFAARQIRYASRPAHGTALAGPVVPAGAAPGRPGRVLDLGDLNVFPLEPARQREALERQFAALLERGARFVVVGGAQDLGPVAMAAAHRAGQYSQPLAAVALRGGATGPLRDRSRPVPAHPELPPRDTPHPTQPSPPRHQDFSPSPLAGEGLGRGGKGGGLRLPWDSCGARVNALLPSKARHRPSWARCTPSFR